MSISMRRRATRYTFAKTKEAALEKPTARVEVEETCAICQEPIGSRTPDGITEGWSKLPCGHRFGSYCIKHYLRVVADDRPSCPVCRRNVYHTCGHPVLPTVLPLPPLSGKALKHAAMTLAAADTCEFQLSQPQGEAPVQVQDPMLQMRMSPCTYCQGPGAVAAAAAVSTAATVATSSSTRKSRLPAIFTRWLRVFNFGSLRKRGHSAAAADRGSGRGDAAAAGTGTAAGTGAGEARGEALTALAAREAREADPTGWQGPWIDPFPRLRDREWEKWWTAQEPRGA